MTVLEVDVPFGVAHRGSRLLWPENTMVAFAGAVDLGFNWLETDLHLTSDGVVVCLHDDDLDRTTDGHGPVSSSTIGEVTSLDAGFHHGTPHDHPFRGEGIGIPTLEELVTTFPSARLIVDLKQDGLEAPVWRLIQRHDLHERLVVGSFSGRRLARFRRLSGGSVATSTGPVRSVVAWAGALAGRAPKLGDAVQLPHRFGVLRPITPRSIRGFQNGGLQVHVWTVNDEPTMRGLLSAGVDAIITDRPDLLGPILDETRSP